MAAPKTTPKTSLENPSPKTRETEALEPEYVEITLPSGTRAVVPAKMARTLLEGK